MRLPPAVEEKTGSELQRNLRQVDYSEYEWMENQDLFDRQIMAELDEEAFYEQCLNEVVEAEEDAWNHAHHFANDCNPHAQPHEDAYISCNSSEPLTTMTNEGNKVASILNPEAAEFFPGNHFKDVTQLAFEQEQEKQTE